MQAFLQDLFHAFRSLRKSPGFTIVACLALSIGIGANTALFSIVNAVLIRPLPFAQPGRLVMVHESIPKFNIERAPLSTIEYGVLGVAAKSFDGFGAFESITGELSAVSPAETLNGAKMTATLFDVLGVQPVVGRTFRTDEDFDGNDTMLIGYGLWTRRFARDPGIVGRAIVLDRKPRVIVGVMPPSFVFPLRGPAANNEPADFYIPMGFTALERQGRGPILQKSVIGRLRAGVSMEAAQAEARSLGGAVGALLPADYIRYFAGIAFDLVPLQQEVTGNVSRILWLLMGAVGVLLLIACANVANLTLTRAAGNRRERAIRTALGASRGALVRLLLCESLVLAVGSGILGLLLAAWAGRFLAVVSPIRLPGGGQVRTDLSVIAFTIVIATATTVLSGIAAALQSSRDSNAAALKDGGRASTVGRSRQRMLGTLVSAQFGLTLVLLMAGSLMLRSLMNTVAANPGFRPSQAVAVTTHLPPAGYAVAAHIRAIYLQVANDAETVPGIKAAGVGTELPLGNWEKGSILGEGTQAALQGTPGVHASQVWITGHYLEALGVPLKRGRFISDVEYREKRGVVVINETLANQLWPGQDAVGRRLLNSRKGWQRVVGVVGDIKEIALNAPAVPQIYEPHSQLTDGLLEMASIPFFKTLNLVSRSASPPDVQMRQLTQVIQHADPSLAISSAVPLGAIVEESSRSQRLDTFLLAAFGGIALLLAVMGVAGVLGYSVVQRKSEIGIRMAVGATPASVSGMILKHGLLLAAGGIVPGLAVSLMAARLFASFLYGVSAYDPLTFILVPAILGTTAIVAAWLPAHRAARVDPLVSLRGE